MSAKYESSSAPACVANNAGDLGGISYGKYQFASNVGSVDKFVDWLCKYPDDKLANYGRVLAAHKVNSPEFVRQWQELGTIDPGNFGRLQDEYMVSVYYGGAADKLRQENFHLERHSDALKAVVFSRAVQNGQSGCKDLFVIACQKLGQPNLSYLDDAFFDGKIISAIYDFLINSTFLLIYEANLNCCNDSFSFLRLHNKGVQPLSRNVSKYSDFMECNSSFTIGTLLTILPVNSSRTAFMLS